MLVRCQWGDPDCGAEVALQDLHRHLVEHHGHQVVQLEQGEEEEGEEGGLSLTEEMMTDCWPDSSGYSSPSVVMISALGHTFLLFMRNKDKMRDDQDLSVCLLGPPKLATRFAYELRLLDEVGFAYRGPMLSATVEREQFWTQVRRERYIGILQLFVSGISSAYSQLGGSRQLLRDLCQDFLQGVKNHRQQMI